jgi:hypothetical protein
MAVGKRKRNPPVLFTTGDGSRSLSHAVFFYCSAQEASATGAGRFLIARTRSRVQLPCAHTHSHFDRELRVRQLHASQAGYFM